MAYRGSQRRTVEPSYFDGKTFNPEVLFPNEFTIIEPSKIVDDPQPQDAGLEVRSVQIRKIFHVTHIQEAREIAQENGCNFKVKQKLGKVSGAYDARSPGESFKPTYDRQKFVKIPSYEDVFPGYYSWWGIYPTPLEEEEEEEEEGVVEYLKAEPESHYGSVGFVCSLQNIINGYARSREAEINNICIRKGGTLRYKKEICYVLIICIESDEDNLNDFDVLGAQGLFLMNGLIDDVGKINDQASIPQFRPRLVYTNASYETTAFAFYFPRHDDELTLTNEECVEENITHTRCIKTKPPAKYAKWVCPDTITEQQ